MMVAKFFLSFLFLLSLGPPLLGLGGLDSSWMFTVDSLQKWDRFVQEQLEEVLDGPTSLRIFTYLYAAQEEAAKISFQTTGKLAGSLDPLSFAVLGLFMPEISQPVDYQEDEYSKALCAKVLPHIRARFEEEERREARFEVPEKYEDDFTDGLSVAKWTLWSTASPKEYWPLPPPRKEDPIWKEQAEDIRRDMKKLTRAQKQIIRLWAGMSDPTKSDWRQIANTYLFSHEIPLRQMIQVRHALMTGLYDAQIVSFSSKYRFLVIRPTMYEPKLRAEIEVPKHPSYPSDHSLLSTTAAEILSHFFPEEATHWNKLAEEASLSRIWAGLHFPIDHQAGRSCGRKIASGILQSALE